MQKLNKKISFEISILVIIIISWAVIFFVYKSEAELDSTQFLKIVDIDRDSDAYILKHHNALEYVDLFSYRDNFINYFSKEDIVISIPDSNNKIIFKEGDNNMESRNLSYDIYVDSYKIGEDEFSEAFDPKFSPKNLYMGFQVWGMLGSENPYFYLNIIDIKNKKVFTIQPPHIDTDYEKEDITDSVQPVIEKYSWVDDKTIEFTTFFMKHISNRVSSRELWRYDIDTRQYLYIETLPEKPVER